MHASPRFKPEWIALAVIALVDLVWAQRIGFRLLVDLRDVLILSAPVALLVAAWKLRATRAALVLEFFCLTMAGATVLGVMSYLSTASAYGPLWDARFLAADRALGFDWLPIYQWIDARPVVFWLLQVLYASVVVQALVAALTLGLRGQQRDMSELYRVIFISSVLTCIGAVLFPALSPHKVFEVRGAFLPHMEQLLSHQNLTFALSELTGVVTFPSFHTVLAMTYGYAFYRAGAFGRAMTVMNGLMLFSIPFMGGHYLVDVFAGMAVFGVALVAVKAWSRLRTAGLLTKLSPPLIADEARS